MGQRGESWNPFRYGNTGKFGYMNAKTLVGMISLRRGIPTRVDIAWVTGFPDITVFPNNQVLWHNSTIFKPNELKLCKKLYIYGVFLGQVGKSPCSLLLELA